jgi:hypothetical protein
MSSARTLAVVTVIVATLIRGLFWEPLAAAKPSISDIKVTSQTDKASVKLSRKAGGNPQEFIKVDLKEVIVTRDPSTGLPTGQRLHKPYVVTMTKDASVCSLLYAVAALAEGGPAARSALQGQGYDCSIMDGGTVECQSLASAQQCTDLANQLAENIDAALALGDQTERGAFQAGVHALGFTTCQTVTTATTTTTSSTTSTTSCPSGQTNCSGTCVNLTNDNNNCGSCGNVCPPATPVCISSVCTIP